MICVPICQPVCPFLIKAALLCPASSFSMYLKREKLKSHQFKHERHYGTSNGTRKVDESVLLLCFDVFESVDPDQTALLDQSGLDPHCRNQ